MSAELIAAIGTLAAGASGLFNRGSGGNAGLGYLDNVKLAQYQDKLQRQWQKDIADPIRKNAIQERVADARAAGLHPLFALGAAGGGSSGPSYVIPGASGGGGTAGSDMGQSLEMLAAGVAELMGRKPEEKDPVQARLEELGLRQREADTRASEAQAAMLESEYFRQVNGLNVQQDAVNLPRDPWSLPDGTPLKYADIYNPLTKKKETHLNPNLGYELPESIGAAMYGRTVLDDIQRGHVAPRKGLAPRMGRGAGGKRLYKEK